jgi:hypothetical protein
MNKSILILLSLLSLNILLVQSRFYKFQAEDDAYASIDEAFGKGSYEVPDCGHKVKHINSIFDPELGKKVMAFTLHVFKDDSMCKDDDRQRVEFRIFRNPKTTWMQNQSSGSSYTFSWMFKLPDDFATSNNFCHFHQLITTETGNPPKLTYSVEGKRFSIKIRPEQNGKPQEVASANLDLFLGQWVKAVETITYGKNGRATIKIFNYKTKNVLLTYDEKVDFSLAQERFQLNTKWGFYRSLANKYELKDETVLFSDFCIADSKSSECSS